MPIEFLNAQGDTVTALDLVTQVTASAAVKRSDGNYGSADAFQSFTATIPPGLPHDTIRAIAQDLYDECRTAVEARLAELAQPKPVSELDEYFGPKRTTPPEPAQPAAPAAVPPQQAGRALQYAPKAADRIPGDTWSATVTHYKLTADKLELWKDTGKFPEASLYPNSPAWPSEEWINHMTKDGSKQPFAKPVTVIQTVGDKKNDKGFYYVNVLKLEVAKAAAA